MGGGLKGGVEVARQRVLSESPVRWIFAQLQCYNRCSRAVGKLFLAIRGKARKSAIRQKVHFLQGALPGLQATEMKPHLPPVLLLYLGFGFSAVSTTAPSSSLALSSFSLSFCESPPIKKILLKGRKGREPSMQGQVCEGQVVNLLSSFSQNNGSFGNIKFIWQGKSR